MTEIDIEQLKYPIGDFIAQEQYSLNERKASIDIIENLPNKLKSTIEGFSESQFNTVYRPGGWTVRQLVHHLADSHMNSFIRFKLTLTEDVPQLKPYLQAEWCNMQDAKTLDIAPSMLILEGVHCRLTKVLRNMTDADFNRKLYHPEMKKKLDLNRMLALYSWHSDHHLAHITGLKERKGWG